MAYKGQIWDDPASGDKIEVLETARENNGARLRYHFTIKQGGLKPALHIHEKQDEIFEVISGKLTYHLHGRLEVAGPGETIVLPQGLPHTHYNGEAKEPLVMIQTIAPALDAEWLIDSFLGLTSDGKIKNGKPDFLQVMVWLKYYKAKTYLANVPVGFQKFLSAILSPIGRLTGYKAAYKKYSGVNA